eukprot:g22382.t1
MLIVIDDMLKAAKNMAQFLCSGEVLDNEGYSIGLILCLSSEELIAVFRCGMSELVIDELSIVSRSYEQGVKLEERSRPGSIRGAEKLTFRVGTLLQVPDPKRQLSCSSDAAWPAVFL